MQENNHQNQNNNNNKKPSLPIWLYCLLGAVVLYLLFSYAATKLEQAQLQEITYDDFLKMLNSNQIKQVVLQYDEERILIQPVRQTEGTIPITYYTGIIENDADLVPLLNEKGISYGREVTDKGNTIVAILVNWILPFVLIYVVMWFLFRMLMKNGNGMMGVGKSNAKVYVERETGVTFKDVAGQEEAKESIYELVDFLHNPGKYTKIGAKLPKGALLVGPPGTGKTLLAKAVAGEAKVPFFSLSGSDFVEMFVGVGASRVRDLFKQAQGMAPCIVFIDEIDAIGKSRDSVYGGGNEEREQTLNQLLSEMDGFDTSKGVVILAATNRPEVLDKALLRPGRFDRRVIVDKPDLKGRLDTLRVHSKNVLMHDSVDLEAIALATSGAVGSDLANIINEAAILAVKEGRTVVMQRDLFESVETVFAGKEKKDRLLSPEEKRIVAYHEVGHALVTTLSKKAEPVQKITIVPRTMGSLGYTMQVPEEEKYLMSKDEMIARITTYFGGRAAEELYFDSVTTGASNDIEQATKIARAMITQYGMSDKFGMIGLESIESRYLDGRAVMNCAEDTAAEVDREVIALLQKCHDEAKRLLEGNRDIMDEVADFLIEKETITGKEFMEIYFRLRPEQKEEAEKREAEKKEEKRIEAEKQEARKKARDEAYQRERETWGKSVMQEPEKPEEAEGTEKPEEAEGTEKPEESGSSDESEEPGETGDRKFVSENDEIDPNEEDDFPRIKR